MQIQLSTQESSFLKNSLLECKELFGPHEKFGGIPITGERKSGTKSGSTLWLHLRDFNEDFIEYNNPHINNVISFLTKFKNENFKDARFGRVYAHCLPPDTFIVRHHDYNDATYFNVIKRFQIFLIFLKMS